MKLTSAPKTALAAAVLAAVASTAVVAQDKPKVIVAIGTTSVDVSQSYNTSIPIYTKCWEKEGLDVVIQPISSGAGMQAVLSGQAQLVNMGSGTALQARAKGAPIKSVFLNIRKNFQFPVVLESSPIKSVADFKGKTIGVISYGAVLVNVTKAMIAEAGLDPAKDVTFIETGAGAQAVSALTSGKVDIWGTWDSQIATAENMGVKLRKFNSPSAEKLDFGSAYFARDDYIKANPQVLEKFLRCAVQGVQVVMANPEGAVRAHWQVYPASKPTGLDDATAMKQALHILKTRLDYVRADPPQKYGELAHESAVSMIDFMRANKQIEGPLDPKDVYTNQFVNAANAVDPATVKALAASLPK
jgi:NitT/TauT family transport system substrate-binding protein